MERHLISYCDILGTRARVKAGKFHPFVSLDFSNPVGIVATAASDMRMAVFSDSVIMSAPETQARRFLSALSFVCTQWIADGIMVRGGVACGEVVWVDDWIDDRFRGLRNLSLSRVYGRALLKAYETEQQNGPGAVVFVHRSATRVLRRVLPSAIAGTQAGPSILNWMHPDAFNWASGYFDVRSRGLRSGNEKRHVDATRAYLRGLGGPGVPENFHFEAVRRVFR